VGRNPIACVAQDVCHDTGTCDPATGLCSNPVKADNTGCGSGRACCGGACTDVTTSPNCGTCGKVCGGGLVCQNGACACPDGKSLCNGGCVTNCGPGFVRDANCHCVCPAPKKQCDGACLDADACCTDDDCSEGCNAGTCCTAGMAQSGACRGVGHCIDVRNTCFARDACETVSCATGTCVRTPVTCHGCIGCHTTTGICVVDLCPACQRCVSSSICVADHDQDYQRGECVFSSEVCYNGHCVDCLPEGAKCDSNPTAPSCCTGACQPFFTLERGTEFICHCLEILNGCDSNEDCCSGKCDSTTKICVL
jgi:hypothetical protein